MNLLRKGGGRGNADPSQCRVEPPPRSALRCVLLRPRISARQRCGDRLDRKESSVATRKWQQGFFLSLNRLGGYVRFLARSGKLSDRCEHRQIETPKRTQCRRDSCRARKCRASENILRREEAVGLSPDINEKKYEKRKKIREAYAARKCSNSLLTIP